MNIRFAMKESVEPFFFISMYRFYLDIQEMQLAYPMKSSEMFCGIQLALGNSNIIHSRQGRIYWQITDHSSY